MCKGSRDTEKPKALAELGRRDSVNPRMLRVLGFKEVMKLWALMVVRMLRSPAC